jgi:hypothetical protein
VFTVQYRCPYRAYWYDHGEFAEFSTASSAAVGLYFKERKIACRVVDEEGRMMYQIPNEIPRAGTIPQCGR